MNDTPSNRRDKAKIIVFLAVLGILGILYYVSKEQQTQLEDLVWDKLQSLGLGAWFISMVFWFIGGLAWIATYLGPWLAARRQKHISGIPGIAFIFFIIAGLTSPHKWLAVIALVDYYAVLIPIRFVLNRRSSK